MDSPAISKCTNPKCACTGCSSCGAACSCEEPREGGGQCGNKYCKCTSCGCGEGCGCNVPIVEG